METVHFGSSLFGFNRKQVLQYIDQTYMSFREDLAKKEEQYRSELEKVRTENEQTIRRLEDHLYEINTESERRRETVENLSAAYEKEVARADEAEAQLQEITQQYEQQVTALTEAENKAVDLEARLQAAQQQLSRKSALADTRAEKMEELSARLDQLESALHEAEEIAGQDVAVADCLTLLQGRNRALCNRIAKLEAQLEEQKSGVHVDACSRAAVQKRETLRETEALFRSVREEIQNALQAISQKIEAGISPDSDDGDNLVDISGL